MHDSLYDELHIQDWQEPGPAAPTAVRERTMNNLGNKGSVHPNKAIVTPMSIAVTAPEKFDFQDLVCVELMLRFEANPDVVMFIERDQGEDAEIILPRQSMPPLVVEVQVKGASGPVTMAEIAACLAHCPPRNASGSLLERLINFPDRVALLVMSGRCDDTASAFVMPSSWDRSPPPAGRIKKAIAATFLREFGSMPAASDSDLMTRRKAHRDMLVSTITPDAIRGILDRVLVFEQIGDAELEIACERHLKTKFRIPSDRIFDVVSRLLREIKEAKGNKTDAIPPMRALLEESAPHSLRPQGYVKRGNETRLADTLSAKNCLLLSGPPRCGKSDAACWIAAKFEQLGYNVQQGTDVEAASRFLLDPSKGERLFVLDDPLGGAHLNSDRGRLLERLGTLISKLSPQRKIVVAQAQDAIFDTLGRTQLQDCSVGGHTWIDLGEYPPGFLSQLWAEMAVISSIPLSLKDRIATALSKAEIVLEPGCLRHLALSGDSLRDDIPFDQTIRLAQQPAKSLGQALAVRPSMETLLIGLAIGSTPSAPITPRELAFAIDSAAVSLPGKVGSPFSRIQFGGDPPAKLTPTYDKVPDLDSETALNLDRLERRGIVTVVSAQIGFSHPYYRASGESIVEAPTARVATVALQIAERALFCLVSATSRASARNLNWLYAAISNRPDAQRKLISICVGGLRSIYPATRDLCFTFLVRHLADLPNELKGDLRGRVRAIASTTLDHVRWENGEAVFPCEDSIDGLEWLNRWLRQVSEDDVSAELNALESEDTSYISPERAAEVLTYFKQAPAALTIRAMSRLLGYDEAILRAEAAHLWLRLNRNDDLVLLSRIFDDQSPTVLVRAFSGACSGWNIYSSDRQRAVLEGLKRATNDPLSALVLIDRLIVFNRVEVFGDNPPWPVFGALMPIVLGILPSDANISEPRLYAAIRDASKELPVDAVIPILTSWISWVEHELARGLLPDDYALAVSAVVLDVTGSQATLRQELVKRLFALPGTGALVAVIRDFVDAWPELDATDRAYVFNALKRDRQDRRWLQAVVLTRRIVPPDLQEAILGNPSALAADPSDLIREMPSELLSAAVAVYCGHPQPLWWLGTHHARGTIWDKIVQHIALRPEHAQFETTLADIISHQNGKDVAAIVEGIAPEHIQRLFDILLRQRINETGNYLSEAWEVLFRRTKDTKTKEKWIDRIVEVAPIMLDDLEDINCWLRGCAERVELLKRFEADLTPLLRLQKLKDLPSNELHALKDDAIAGLKGLLTKEPPRLFGTYDRIVRDCETLGLENAELSALLSEGRVKIFEDRDKRRNEECCSDPRPDGWIAP